MERCTRKRKDTFALAPPTRACRNELGFNIVNNTLVICNYCWLRWVCMLVG